MTFGEKLIHLRKAAGMSQEELAQKLYLSRQAVHKWENGLSMPDIDNLRLLSSTFSVSIDSLLDDSQTLPALPAAETAIAEKPAALSYGKAQRSGLTPASVDANEDNQRKTRAEVKQLRIRRTGLWLTGIPALLCIAATIIALIVAMVQSQTGTPAQAANTFILCIIFVGIGLAFGIPWLCCDKYLYRNALVSRSYYFIVKEHSEKYLKEKHYWYQMLQSDLLVWFFFDPAARSFGFYFKDGEQFICPIQNYFSFTCFSSGHGIQQGEPRTSFGAMFGDIHGFSVGSVPTYISRDDTTFNFTLLYFDEHGTEREYHYVLNAIRSYTIDIADSNLDVHVALQNAISHSTVAAFNKIKNKLDIEKQKLTM